jgi:hypothetical protein
MALALMIARLPKEVGTIRRAFVGRRVEVDAGYARSFGQTTYMYAAVLEFEDAEGLVAYLNHPLHNALGDLFWQLCASTAIVEVEALELGDSRLIDLLGG